jgi:hypothetical protein
MILIQNNTKIFEAPDTAVMCVPFLTFFTFKYIIKIHDLVDEYCKKITIKNLLLQSALKLNLSM